MAFRFEHLSVLVVEDTAPMRKLLTSVLEGLGVKKIDAAGDAKTAFDLFQKFNHDLIITDWLMEGENGIELTQRIRTDMTSPNRMVPVIVITGYSATRRVETARDSGVTEFLVKPFTANDLARRIAHVITRPRNFIETQDFFGPDRRRRDDEEYDGPDRRGSYDPNDIVFE